MLALWTLTAAAASDPGAHGSREQQRELDRAESLLQEWLMGLPPDIGVAIVRGQDRVTLRFPGSRVFDADSSALKADASSAAPMTAALRLLKRRRVLAADIAVFTDSVGGESANQSFSAARAKALRSALVAQGIAASRLHQRGAGSSEPLSSNDAPEGRMLNRRVEITFSRAGH